MKPFSITKWTLGGALLLLLCSPVMASESQLSPRQIFEQRIMPIFNSPNPSSCTQCHLSGVDLKNYILPSHEKTFLSLRDLGLIDMEQPEQSKILKLINMGAEYPEKENLISKKMREAEFAAFAEWIKASARDPKLRDAPPLPRAELAKPSRPDEVIRHGRMDRLAASFERNIWSLQFRCNHCHIPGGLKFEKHQKEHGDVMAWMRPEGPEATMRYIIEKGLVDAKNPRQSKLLLKALNEIEHGGGQKMRLNDTDYMAFLTWIEDYAKVVNDEYASVGDLPSAPGRVGTEIWLRVAGLPEGWLDRTGIATIHSWNEASRKWVEQPSALSAFTVIRNPRWGTFFNAFLMLQARSGAAPEPLAQGRYQVRLHLDPGPRATADWDKALAAAKFVAAAEVTTDWKSGFLKATAIDGQSLRLAAAAP